MIKIHHHHNLPFSAHHHMELSPVLSEDDNLIQEIDNDYISHGNDWTLEIAPDSQNLQDFWGNVEQDIHNDPTWFDFDDE